MAWDMAKREAFIVENLVQDRLRMAEIEGYDGIARFAELPEKDLVVAGIFIFLEEREILHQNMAVLHVDFTGYGAQIQNLGVFDNIGGDLVDVGQLVAGGVHLPVVGVALQHDRNFGRNLGEAPGER